MLTHINNSLKKSIKKAGIAKEVEAYMVCENCERIVKNLFGQKFLEKIHRMNFKNNVLTFFILDSSFVLAQELKFKEKRIIKEVNKKIGKDVVRKIRFEM